MTRAINVTDAPKDLDLREAVIWVSGYNHAIEAGSAWPCDGIGDEHGNFVCKRDMELRTTQRLVRSAMQDSADILSALSMATEGHLRGRICTVLNRLNIELGRGQSSHGEQFKRSGDGTVIAAVTDGNIG